MAKKRKISAEERERMRTSAERGRQFRKMLEERQKVDERLAAERSSREATQEP